VNLSFEAAMKIKKARKAKRKAKAKRLGRKPSLSSLKKKLWSLLSPLMKAAYPAVCFTCDRPISGAGHHLGHMFPAGSNSLTRFDPANLRPQCYHCNINLGGNGAEFARRYQNRYGTELFFAVATASQVSKKWTAPEIEDLIYHAKYGFPSYLKFHRLAYPLQNASQTA